MKAKALLVALIVVMVSMTSYSQDVSSNAAALVAMTHQDTLQRVKAGRDSLLSLSGQSVADSLPTKVKHKSNLKERIMAYAKRKHWDSLENIANKNKFLRFCVGAYQWCDRTFNTYDTAYVVGVGYKWKVMLKEDNWFDSYSFRLQNDPTGEYPVTWDSNMTSMLGLSVSFMAVSVGYSFDISRMHQQIPISRKVFDFDFCSSRLSASMRYIRNKDNFDVKDVPEFEQMLPGVKIDGVTNKIWDLTAYYFFNNYKYSQSAAYNYSKIQRRSAGSPLLGLSIVLNDVKVNLEDPNNLLPELAELHNLHVKSNIYNLLFGYGFNWVPTPKLVINITGTPSIGWRYGHKTSGDGTDVNRTVFSLNLRLRTGITYNITRRWFVSLHGSYFRELYRHSEYSFMSSVGKFGVVAGFRF